MSFLEYQSQPDDAPRGKLDIVRRYALACLLVVLATMLAGRSLNWLGEISPFFFVAVMLSSWFGGVGPGLLATGLAGWASIHFFYDFPKGTTGFGTDDAVRLMVFLMIALLISFLVNRRRRVERDITELQRLEKEVLEISEREQRRMGGDLHDGLGQELTGLAFLSQNLARKLDERSLPEADELRRMADLINSAIEKTRDLAKGLAPVEWGPDGLSAALQNLSTRVKESFGIPCEFRRLHPVQVPSHVTAVHLYRIAQEAVSNSARHSKAKHIWISIDAIGPEVTLTIEDDGIGIGTRDPNSTGMGLHLMPYRARMIGAAFEVQPRAGGGTMVRCSVQ